MLVTTESNSGNRLNLEGQSYSETAFRAKSAAAPRASTRMRALETRRMEIRLLLENDAFRGAVHPPRRKVH